MIVVLHFDVVVTPIYTNRQSIFDCGIAVAILISQNMSVATFSQPDLLINNVETARDRPTINIIVVVLERFLL